MDDESLKADERFNRSTANIDATNGSHLNDRPDPCENTAFEIKRVRTTLESESSVTCADVHRSHERRCNEHCGAEPEANAYVQLIDDADRQPKPRSNYQSGSQPDQQNSFVDRLHTF